MSMDQIHTRKQQLRLGMKRRIAELTQGVRLRSDDALREQCRKWFREHADTMSESIWRGRTLMAYMPLPDEPDLTPLLQDCLSGGGTCILPRVKDETQMTLNQVTELVREGLAKQGARLSVIRPHAGERQDR